MTGTEMALVLKIRANAEQAVAELKKTQENLSRSSLAVKEFGAAVKRTFSSVDSVIKRTSDGFDTVGKSGKKAFDIISGAGGTFLKPVEYMIKAAGLAAGSMLTLGAAALKAASDDEALIARLEMAGYSAEGARKEFEKLEKFARNSSFKVDDLAEATMYLKEFGLAGDKNLAAVANAAKFTGGSMADLAMQIGALQARGLKRFGINVESKDDKFVVEWRNKLGVWQKDIAKNAEEARRKLLEVVGGKFGTEIKSPKTLSGALGAMKNSVEQIFANIGTPMLGAATRFVNFLREKLEKLFGSGKLEEMGKKFGEWIDNAAAVVEGIADEFGNIAKALKTIWDSPQGFANLIQSMMMGAGKILGSAFFGMVQASLSTWKLVGDVLGAAIREQVLQLPMFKLERVKEAGETAKSIVAQGRTEEFKKIDPNAIKRIREIMAEGETETIAAASWARRDLDSTQQAKLATMLDPRDIKKAAKDFEVGMGVAMQMVSDGITEAGNGVNDVFKKESGYDLKKNVGTAIQARMTANELARAKGRDSVAPEDAVESNVPSATIKSRQGQNLNSIRTGQSGNVNIRVSHPEPTYAYREFKNQIQLSEEPSYSAAGM